VNVVLQTMVTTMAGPRMMISLRRNFAKALNAGTAGSNELKTLAFARAPQNAEGETLSA